MKISICGKGGSGKSAVTTLLAGAMRRKGYRVLVVDADESNSVLYRMLGFDTPPAPLLQLAGGKKMVRQALGPKGPADDTMPGTTVLAQQEIAVVQIPPDYVRDRDGVRLVAIGKIMQALEGCACPMGVLSREFLGKLRLENDEAVIVDMEAGVEHFGRGVETSLDSVLAVVEPSFESVQLADRVKELAHGSGIGNVWAVLNKITAEELADRLKGELGQRGLDVIGVIHLDQQVFESCLEGRPLSGGGAQQEAGQLLEAILSRL